MTSPFDRFARALAVRMDRRQAVATGAAGLVLTGAAAATGLAQAAQDPPATPEAALATPTPGAAEKTFFLFVQTFSAGTLTPHATDPNFYTLTLSGHAAETVFFSDRPERIVGSLPTTEFLDTLGFSPDNPPNAALVAGEHVVVLELINPVYEETFGPDGTVTLTYDVAILEDYAEEGLAHLARQTTGTVPESFDSASLFIDDCPNVTLSCSSAGEVFASYPISQCVNRFGHCQPCNRGYGVGGSAPLAAECNAVYPNQCGGQCTGLAS